MKWLEETHGTKFELVRHFLARMFDSELFSAPGQWQKVAVGAFSMALMAGMVLLDPMSKAKYSHLSALATPEPFRAAALADEVALLTLAMAITGLLGLLQWESLFPSKRDYLGLAGLPIRPRQVFIARFASAMVLSIGIVLAMNILASVIVPVQFTGRWQRNPSYLANVAAHWASCGLACFFVLLAIVALQGVLLNLLPGRLFTRVSSYLQGLLIAVLFLSALYSWSISDWTPATLDKLPQFGAWAPPVWFAGLHEKLLGDRDPFLGAMASRALLAGAAAGILAALAYVVSYKRYRKLLLESSFEVARPARRQWTLLGLLARDPQRRAVLEFMTKTLARSRVHRMVLMAYIGVAVAVMLNSSLLASAAVKGSGGLRGNLKFIVLFWPLTATVIVLAGLRHAFSLPADLPSNWVFRMTESQGRAQWMSAVERFVIVYAIVPIYVVLSPLAVALVGWEIAARMTVLEVVVSLTMFEMRFQSWQQLPFTCSYAPGKRPLVMLLAGWLAAIGVAVPVLTIIISTASRMTAPFLIYLSMFVGVWIWARRFRRDGWGEAPMLYEDLPDALPDLGLRG
jgi:hypothetical protein